MEEILGLDYVEMGGVTKSFIEKIRNEKALDDMKQKWIAFEGELNSAGSKKRSFLNLDY